MADTPEIREDPDARTRTGTGPLGALPPPPTSVGPYRILKEIAHGGMGAVYLALRDDDQYRQRVAIKLLRRGIESDAIVRRFRQERQMLASIEHPFIARLLDGGSTADGLPYLVMEYIDGQPVDEYCDARRLSIEERLELFRKVCTAVQFAHQNLIVHRDLKPSNVLVTADGTPKLVDFGIAKPLKPELLGLTVDPTAVHLPMLTPEYASPEHVRGETVTTASDVYSLGVLLYELLTGHRPYRLKSRQMHEIARVICEEEPTRPSTVVNQVEEVHSADGSVQRLTPDTVSRSRESSPERLSRKLRGDLENIVLMAMRKEPQRRYVSVDQFSDDIRRYQDALPVRARKDTFGYRASRFTRRHRVPLGLTAAVVIALVGFSVVTARERRRAQEEANRAKAAIAFLTSTLAAVDPRRAQGTEPTVRDMLDEAERRLSSAQALPSSERDAIREVLAESRFQLGHYKQARDHYSVLRTAYSQRLGDENPATLAALARVAASQGQLGELKEGEANARRAAAGFAAIAGADPKGSITAMNTLAHVLLEVGGKDPIAEADRLLAESAALGEKTLKPDDPGRIATSHLLVKLRASQSNYRAAEPLARENYRFALSALGRHHPDTVEALDLLTGCLLYMSKFSEALALVKEHADAARDVLGPDHATTLSAEHQLAETLRMTGRYAEARDVNERVLAAKTRILGERHRSTLVTRHNLALTYKDLKDPARAETILREVTRIKKETFGPADADTLLSEAMIALTLFEQQRLPEARDAYAEVLPRVKASLGEGSREYLVGTVNYASLLSRLGEHHVAERALRESVAAHERVFGPEFYGTHYTKLELATTLIQLGRFDEAEPLLLTALAGFREVYKSQPNHTRVRQTLARLVKLYEAWQKPQKAEEYKALLKKAEEESKQKPS